MTTKKEKLTFILLKGKVYPMGEKSDECPMPLIQAQTFEMVRTPAQVLLHLAKLGNTFMGGELCWSNCPLECPAKQHIVDVLVAFLDKK